MCNICNCIGWIFDMFVTLITWILGCIVVLVLCLGFTVAIVAGVAYGYNYSVAEFIYTARDDVMFFRKSESVNTNSRDFQPFPTVTTTTATTPTTQQSNPTARILSELESEDEDDMINRKMFGNKNQRTTKNKIQEKDNVNATVPILSVTTNTFATAPRGLPPMELQEHEENINQNFLGNRTQGNAIEGIHPKENPNRTVHVTPVNTYAAPTLLGLPGIWNGAIHDDDDMIIHRLFANRKQGSPTPGIQHKKKPTMIVATTASPTAPTIASTTKSTMAPTTKSTTAPTTKSTHTTFKNIFRRKDVYLSDLFPQRTIKATNLPLRTKKYPTRRINSPAKTKATIIALDHTVSKHVLLDIPDYTEEFD